MVGISLLTHHDISFLDPSNLPAPVYNHRLTTPLPLSGSAEPFMDYVWCTPKTKTYTFFGVGTVNPQPYQSYDTTGALAQAVNTLISYLKHNLDGPLDGGQWTVSPPTTGIEIYVQNSKGTMTYGVLLSALTGLSQVAETYVREKKTMVFQINDGKWGELGIGYVGFVYPGAKSNCAYDIVDNIVSYCEDVRKGLVIK